MSVQLVPAVVTILEGLSPRQKPGSLFPPFPLFLFMHCTVVLGRLDIASGMIPKNFEDEFIAALFSERGLHNTPEIQGQELVCSLLLYD